MVSAEKTQEHLSDKPAVGGFDHNSVRLDQEWEVIYWCMVLQCTKQQLIEAVAKVGTSAALLRKALKN